MYLDVKQAGSPSFVNTDEVNLVKAAATIGGPLGFLVNVAMLKECII